MNYHNHSYQRLSDDLYTTVLPDKVLNPKPVIINERLMNELGFDIIDGDDSDNTDMMIDAQIEKLVQILSGNLIVKDTIPIAQAYAGHQFGHLNILGDGRAVLLAEVYNKSGSLFDLQLKGSGRTPYSRRGDGKATLAPMLREYIISEAMHALGINTTRSLGVIDTGEVVYRQKREIGAILGRIASSHIRVGTFVYANLLYHDAKKTMEREQAIYPLTELLNYTVNRHYPELNHLPNNEKALSLFDYVMKRQAKLVADWQRVGFIHGVMNTDNITISGETIDYGPCAFMDGYDENTVFSSIDYQGRYAFKNQMPIMWWNMARFAESLLPLIDSNEAKAIELTEASIQNFSHYFNGYWADILCAKIGLKALDFEFAKELLALLQEHHLDYTNTFVGLTRYLMKKVSQDDSNFETLELSVEILQNQPAITALNDWLQQWQKKIMQEDVNQAIQSMQTHNPIIIPRNHLVEQALQEVEEDMESGMITFQQLLSAIQAPYDWSEDAKNRTQDFQCPASRDWNNSFQTFCGT